MTMQDKVTLDRKSLLKNYIELTKPGIIMGNGITAIAGYLLASQGQGDLFLFVAMLLGLSLVMASACVYNNYIDKELDKKMVRTQNRPLPRRFITEKNALIFGSILGIFGFLTLGVFTNLLTTAIALFGFIVYVLIYSFMKYFTPLFTLIGSAAGAVPPVVGYVASTAHLDSCAALLFFMLVCWQMPHFFAIALYRIKDYEAGAIPVLPLKKGLLTTKIQMLLYIIAFTFVSALFTLFHHTGKVYLIVTLLIGGSWLLLSFQGFSSRDEQKWGRRMFVVSLVAIMSLCLTIALEKLIF